MNVSLGRRARFVALSLLVCAGVAPAQVLSWLPISDLPLSAGEIGGSPVIPAVATMCMWDPDADGPKPRCVVVAGSLNLPNAGSPMQLAYFDEDGWVPLDTPRGAYAIAAYRSPLAAREELFYATSNRIYRRDGDVWTLLRNMSFVKAMQVLDIDGAGPQPAKLFLSSGSVVYSYDGATFTQIGASSGNEYIYSLLVWDVDGSGHPSLLTAGSQGVTRWNGSSWSNFALDGDGSTWSMCSIDFDGDGPGVEELVVSGTFSTLGGVATGPVAVRRNGVWTSLGATADATAIYRSVAFDPDGSGPMTPRLVVGGQFSSIGGVSAPSLAYYSEGSWQVFPEHWNSVATCLGINDGAAFSDSPQLVVGALQGLRPAVGVVALCNTPPGFFQEPPNSNRPAGTTIALGVQPTGDELSFRWFKGATALVSGTTASGSVIAGAASPRLTISNITEQDEGEYRLQIGNGLGNITTRSAAVTLGCAADFNADGEADMFDYLDFVDAYSADGPAADFNFDQTIDLTDYLEFVAAFSDGC